jgi:hypothetical protein
MLSGIGPSKLLKAAGIDVKLDLPGVGQSLGDHMLLTTTAFLDGSFENRATLDFPPTALLTGFLKNRNICSSKEYSTLPCDVQKHIAKPTVPVIEVVVVRFESRRAR